MQMSVQPVDDGARDHQCSGVEVVKHELESVKELAKLDWNKIVCT